MFIDQNSNAFKEVAIVRHPRIGEYAFGFITSSVILRKGMGDEELCCVYVPSNHLYLGDIFLINSKDVMRPNLSVREGIGTIYQTYKSLTNKRIIFNYKNLMVIWLLNLVWCRNCYLRGHISSTSINGAGWAKYYSGNNWHFSCVKCLMA